MPVRESAHEPKEPEASHRRTAGARNRHLSLALLPYCTSTILGSSTNEMPAVPLMRLQCGCNSYEWGKPGRTSAAATYAAATGFEIDDSKAYAELWMGTHPSLPSRDLETQRTLLDLVRDNQALMTPEIAQRYDHKLPFLFKVLSIAKALSIQAHPNKTLAEQLHARDPKNYPDDNHKPEMTIAITPFEGLCGFRPLDQISHFLQHVHPLRLLVGDDVSDEFIATVKEHDKTTDPAQMHRNKQVLKVAFASLMSHATSASSKLPAAADALVSAAQSDGTMFAGGDNSSPTSGAELGRLVLRLHGQFPADIGLFVLFFLNYLQLDVGEALFLRADDIHAYLSGDIIECMASSDNVCRAGFTPKFKDIDTLTSMLTYSYAPIEEQKMNPEDYTFVKLNTVAFQSNSSSVLYDPPISEFAVVKTDLHREGAKATFEPLDGPSIIICTRGRGTIAVGAKKENVKEGFVYFVGASAECVLESETESDTTFTTFKAFCELNEDPVTNGKV
ncbi:MAG: hypothetical protein Q9162_005944 [Coniocarpon cinnabarinum]